MLELHSWSLAGAVDGYFASELADSLNTVRTSTSITYVGKNASWLICWPILVCNHFFFLSYIFFEKKMRRKWYAKLILYLSFLKYICALMNDHYDCMNSPLCSTFTVIE